MRMRVERFYVERRRRRLERKQAARWDYWGLKSQPWLERVARYSKGAKDESNRNRVDTSDWLETQGGERFRGNMC
jgi:hypothetical protein